MTPLPALIVDALAAHRITRLVTVDTITQPLRDRFLAWAWRDRPDEVLVAARTRGDVDQDGTVVDVPPGDDPRLHLLPEGSIQGAMKDGLLVDPPKLATLITCRWCAGVYVAAAVVGLSAARIPGWRTFLRVMATASCAALLAAPEDD